MILFKIFKHRVILNINCKKILNEKNDLSKSKQVKKCNILLSLFPDLVNDTDKIMRQLLELYNIELEKLEQIISYLNSYKIKNVKDLNFSDSLKLYEEKEKRF